MKKLLVILCFFLSYNAAYAQEEDTLSISEQCYQEANTDCDFESAVITCQKAIDADKNNFKLFQALGEASFGLEDYGKAVASYQKVIALGSAKPHDIWYANNMIAKCYGYLDKLEEAVKYFRKANASEDTNVESHMNLAGTLHKMKHSDEAKVEYHKALDVARKNKNSEDIDFLEKEIKNYGY